MEILLFLILLVLVIKFFPEVVNVIWGGILVLCAIIGGLVLLAIII